jgi:hypothetical protein
VHRKPGIRLQVLILSAAHSAARHSAALRKLGILQQQAQVAFVTAAEYTASSGEWPSQVHSGQEPSGVVADAAAGAENPELLANRAGGQPALQRLLKRMVAAAEALLSDLQCQQQQQQQQQPLTSSTTAASVSMAGSGYGHGERPGGLTVVLDSLSALQSLFPGQHEASAFLHYCHALGTSLRQPRYRFVVLAAADAPGDTVLLSTLQHSASAVLSLTPVEGRTAELDGRLDVTLRRLPIAWVAQGAAETTESAAGKKAAADGVAVGAGIALGTRSWHFRAGDVAVRWLPDRLDGKELMV